MHVPNKYILKINKSEKTDLNNKYFNNKYLIIKEFLLDEKKISQEENFSEIHTGKLNPQTGIHFLYENLLLIFRSL